MVAAMMSDRPKAISERFTIYLDANGSHVEQRLSNMMAAEVLAALRWQRETLAQLTMAADAAHQMIEAEFNLSEDALSDAVAVFRELAYEQAREVHLLNLIISAMPQWQQYPEVWLFEAIRRFWRRSVPTADADLDQDLMTG